MRAFARTSLWAAALGALASVVAAQAAPPGRGAVKRRITVEPTTPAGTQSGSVALLFRLASKGRRYVEVSLEYGFDRNGDARVDESEFRPATLNVLDPRSTGVLRGRAGRERLRFDTGGIDGSQHAIVWNSREDVGTDFSYVTLRHTPTGRRIPDPNFPGEFLIEDVSEGVKFRLRALSRRGRPVSQWMSTAGFELVNSLPPSVSIDAVADQGGITSITWTGRHPESEDANGNGLLDVEAGEDSNANLVLDSAPLAVFFDYHPVYETEDVAEIAAMSEEELDRLDWGACTRADGVGDGDAFPPGVPSTPAGRTFVFAWQHSADRLYPPLPVILRGRVMDFRGTESAYAYWFVPYSPGP